MFRFLSFTSIFLTIFTPFVVIAHGEGGSYETVKEGFVVDIGYTPEVIDTTSQTRFDFAAYSEADPSGTSTTFTDVWVRINQDKTLHFSGNINRPEFGPTGFGTILSEPGEYQVFARFQRDGESLVEVEFPITVVASEDATAGTISPMKVMLGAGGVLFVGLLIGFMVGRRKTNYVHES